MQKLDAEEFGSQQNSPEEGIPVGGPIPLHRDTTIDPPSCLPIHLSTYLSIYPPLSLSLYIYLYIYIYIYIYIHTHTHTYIYIYIYIYREREIER